MNRGDGAAKVCARVNEVMKALPRPRRGATREEFFAQRNLWSVEIQSTCDQVIEYYEGILLLVDQGGCTDRLPPWQGVSMKHPSAWNTRAATRASCEIGSKGK